MSVVVLGMEMPESCNMCYISVLKCDLWKETANGNRHPDCPFCPLPEKHGDLIDRNAILEEAKRISGPFTGDGWDNWGVYALIDRQPTIVEEEVQSEPLTISGTAYFINDVIYLDPDFNQMEEE